MISAQTTEALDATVAASRVIRARCSPKEGFTPIGGQAFSERICGAGAAPANVIVIASHVILQRLKRNILAFYMLECDWIARDSFAQ